MNHGKVILDLCGGTGAWSEPYREAGYDVRIIDSGACSTGDVRYFKHLGRPVHGVLAAPPCTVFAASGARWPRSQDDMDRAVAIVDACLRIVAAHGPCWWALENPIGTLRTWLGPPALVFDPCDYGDPYTKRTLIWGLFQAPERAPVEPTEGSKMHLMSSSQAAERAITPPGFARAFFLANP